LFKRCECSLVCLNSVLPQREEVAGFQRRGFLGNLSARRQVPSGEKCSYSLQSQEFFLRVIARDHSIVVPDAREKSVAIYTVNTREPVIAIEDLRYRSYRTFPYIRETKPGLERINTSLNTFLSAQQRCIVKHGIYKPETFLFRRVQKTIETYLMICYRYTLRYFTEISKTTYACAVEPFLHGSPRDIKR